MQFDYSNRVKASITIIVLFALLSNYQLLTGWIEFDLSFVGRDGITSFEKRFELVKTRLPEHAVVGYTVVGSAGNETEDLLQLYLTQYTLAPRAVVKDSSQKFVLKIDQTVRGQAQDGFSVNKCEGGLKEYDFGNGISLIEKSR